jgi:fumarate reductase subunit C
MLEIRLYLAQRISAAIMAPLVLLHLGLMIYAIQGGLDAADVLGQYLCSVCVRSVGTRGDRFA